MCTDEKCDPRTVAQGGTQGVCLYTDVACFDKNKCTKDLCQPSTGCDFSQKEPLPKEFNFCLNWRCDSLVGNQTFDNSAARCNSTDKCIVNYCNYTQGTSTISGVTVKGSCVPIDRMTISAGTYVYYKDAANNTIPVLGCANPGGNTPSCITFSCDKVTGNCIKDFSKCQCLQNSDCDDNDGCTDDVCDSSYNCKHTKKDCWSILSNTNCQSGITPITTSTAAGIAYYTSGNKQTGLPTPANRTCDELACYGGQQSSYSCSSTGSQSFTCLRSVVNCQSSACQDKVCRTLSGWNSDGQINTDCATTYPYSCIDSNACTSNICNSTWSGSSCAQNGNCYSVSGGNRCIHNDNSSSCNDNSVCTTDTCNSGSGCVYTTKTLPSNTCYTYTCDPVKGNIQTVKTGACTSTNATDLCQIVYCDPSGSGSCVNINRRTTPTTTTISYTDAAGNSVNIQGCQKAPSGCTTFGCDYSTGQCTIDSSSCGCTSLNDIRCDDGNPCTIDTCNVGPGNCNNIPVDCWKEMSANVGCISGTSSNSFNSNATAWSYYQNQISTGNYATTPYTNISRTCDEMACFAGQKSQYVCAALTSTTYQCQRKTTECPKGGCQDTICQSSNHWTNGQLDTSCVVAYNTVCNSDKCNTRTCNTSFVYGDDYNTLRCVSTNNASSCVDGDQCTVDGLCNPATGCTYTTETPSPSQNGTCFKYFCNPTTGWYQVPQTCTSSGPCLVPYCDTTANGGLGACVTINKNDIVRGVPFTYTDQFGSQKTVEGCKIPSSEQWTCKTYSCDGTGNCVIDLSNCVCFGDEACQDGNPCTIDRCINGGRTCQRTTVDCYSTLSSGTCNSLTGGNFPMDVFTGIDVYYKNATTDLTTLDSNGLPPVATRSCGNLACYNGQQSQYICTGTAENNYQCSRIAVNCSRNGCKDDICRALGTWTNGQADTDCGTTYVPSCADIDSCTNDFCNTTWVPTDDVSLRCIHQPVNGTQFCDDGNFCTRDFCDNQDTSGDVCKHTLYENWYIKRYLCTNFTGKCKNVECTVNRCIYSDVLCPVSSLCHYHICNATTNGTCGSFPTGIYFEDKCGVCGGNGLSCTPDVPGNPKKTSIAVALGVGLGVGLVFALAIIGILSKKGFDQYMALSTEVQGNVTNAPTYQGGSDHIDTSHYNQGGSPRN